MSAMQSLLPGIAAWLAQWSSMGGYAAFVWPAYAVAAVVLGGLSWHSWRAHRISGRALDRLQPGADSESGPGR
jgi:heme exporter protein D